LRFVLTLLLLALFAFNTSATPIVGGSPSVLPAGKFMNETHITYTNFTAQWNPTDEEYVDFPDDQSASSFVLIPQFYYGPTDWLSLRLTIPVLGLSQDLGEDQSAFGIGDIVFDPKFKIWWSDNRDIRVSGAVGARFPTGNTDSEIPLGDGSTDFVWVLLPSEKVCQFTFYQNLGMWINGENENGDDIDDVLFYNLTVEWNASPKFGTLVEIQGGNTLGDSDASSLHIAPGLYYNVSKSLMLDACIEIPIADKGGRLFAAKPYVGFYIVW